MSVRACAVCKDSSVHLATLFIPTISDKIIHHIFAHKIFLDPGSLGNGQFHIRTGCVQQIGDLLGNAELHQIGVSADKSLLEALGSNDAGASLVALTAAFCNSYYSELSYNLVLALTAEEEVMGEKGMRAMLPEFERLGIKIDMALVGEPTGMDAAVGERGLLVFDATVHGVRGHAARNEGENALYKAIEDIERLRNYRFERCSELLGEINVAVTMISAGLQHNVVPDECKFVVDVRTTDAYTNEETVELLQSLVECEMVPRSTRVRASAIGDEHPLVKAAVAMGRATFVSPTTSDMALMPFPSLKMGVGESARSHSADEFVFESEIVEGVALYDIFINELNKLI